MAALALISTEFRGVDDAVLWITERVEGKILHPFSASSLQAAVRLRKKKA